MGSGVGKALLSYAQDFTDHMGYQWKIKNPIKAPDEWGSLGGALNWKPGVEGLSESPWRWFMGNNFIEKSDEWGCGQERHEEKLLLTPYKAYMADGWVSVFLQCVKISASLVSAYTPLRTLRIPASTLWSATQPDRGSERNWSSLEQLISWVYVVSTETKLCLWFGMSSWFRGCMLSWACRNVLVCRWMWDRLQTVMCFQQALIPFPWGIIIRCKMTHKEKDNHADSLRPISFLLLFLFWGAIPQNSTQGLILALCSGDGPGSDPWTKWCQDWTLVSCMQSICSACGANSIPFQIFITC